MAPAANIPQVMSDFSGSMARMPKGICSICAAPPDVLEAVNRAIRAKENFRNLASRTSFSRAALHRHATKHVQRDILAAHKAEIFDARTQLLWSLFPDGSLFRQQIPHGYVGELRTEPGPNDLILEIGYSRAVPERISTPKIETESGEG